LIGSTGSSFGQYSETISSDRPGFTNSANTVGARVVQFQLGGRFLGRNQQFTWNNDAEYLGGSFNGTVRVGILERFEIGFPVAYQSLKRQNPTFGNNEPLEHLEFGIAVRGNVLQSNGKTPDIGLMGEIRFPDKETERFSDYIFLLFLTQIQQPLERRIKLSTNIGMIRTFYSDLIYTLNLSVDISAITTIYVEHYGAYRIEYDQSSFGNSSPEKYDFWYGNVNGGFAIRPSNNVQIDLQGGYGSLAVGPYESQDWFAELGISWRFRFKKRQKKSSSSTPPALN
jgi:hypothetical protein